MKLRKLSAMAMATAMMVAAIGGTNAFAAQPTKTVDNELYLGTPIYEGKVAESSNASTIVSVDVKAGNAIVYVPASITFDDYRFESSRNKAYKIFVEDGIDTAHSLGLLESQQIKIDLKGEDNATSKDTVTLTNISDETASKLTANMNFINKNADEDEFAGVIVTADDFKDANSEYTGEYVINKTASYEGTPSVAGSYEGYATWLISMESE